MDPTRFLDDLEAKPQALTALAGSLGDVDPWGEAIASAAQPVERVLFLGMGSSTFAAGVAAARLRASGQYAVAELASSALLPPPSPGTLVVAVSASGGSSETVAAAQRYAGHVPLVALTNTEGSVLAGLADVTVGMRAGVETGGVACRSFQHTLVLLLALERSLGVTGPDLSSTVRRAAEASDDLLSRRTQWLEPATDWLAGPSGTFAVAPAARLSSAQQSALMMREGPRRPAVASETGEWSHVDVYLTKTLDYRMLLFPGSAYDAELLRWTTERGATVVAVGREVPQATGSVRFRHDDDELVCLLSDVLVAELVAQRLWADSSPTR
jgi:glutamine---fructose-6-phosphate transaminase (isomerizing)